MSSSSSQKSESKSFDAEEEPHHADVFAPKFAINLESQPAEKVEIKTNQEFSIVPQSASQHNFAAVIRLKAPSTPPATSDDRGPLDLVTVLDVSGSMAGGKLQLVKSAMRFVIGNLRPVDRLSVVIFSQAAERVFPLQRMSASGRRQAVEVVDSLLSLSSTNIADGLREGVKVIEQREEKNPVRSIMLLSDGHDTCGLSSFPCAIPVHSFGFGADHDSVLLHSISDGSGGTFSFVQDVSAIRDAFAQCIGGLMTVVAQDLTVGVACVHQHARIRSVNSGSYSSSVAGDNRSGWIRVGDLYADEQRDFLVVMDVDASLTGPSEQEEGGGGGGGGDHNEDDGRGVVTTLLKVDCTYEDPGNGEGSSTKVSAEEASVEIRRPREGVVEATMSAEVQREKDRVRALEAMKEARAASEREELTAASAILNGVEERVEASAQMFGYDASELVGELQGMAEGMASALRYEKFGRARLLAGSSTHSTQRATFTSYGKPGSGPSVYETPAMGRMVRRSRQSEPPQS